MEQEDRNNASRVVIKCRIEAKEPSGETVHGFYMCVTDARDIEYDGALFSRDTIETEAPLSALYAALEAPAPDGRGKEMEKYENRLKDYVRTSRLFQTEKSLEDPKALEHRITYFCASDMSLNAISFLELTSMSRDELYLTIPSLKREDNTQNGEDQSEREEEAAMGGAEGSAPTDVVISCDPVLDPANGVPAASLSVGDLVSCKLREDSVFFDLIGKSMPGFSGTVSGEITGIHVSELGSALISLKLSDGIVSVIKLDGNVRIKALPRKDPPKTAWIKSLLRFEVLMAVSGVAVFLFVMWILLRDWG
jgi:hypothetical protein